MNAVHPGKSRDKREALIGRLRNHMTKREEIVRQQ